MATNRGYKRKGNCIYHYRACEVFYGLECNCQDIWVEWAKHSFIWRVWHWEDHPQAQ